MATHEGSVSETVETRVSVDAVLIKGPRDEFPSAEIPTVFADGVFNLAHTAEIVKFYPYRLDPGLKNLSDYQTQPVAQVVMSRAAFVATAAFFSSAVEALNAGKPLSSPRTEPLT